MPSKRKRKAVNYSEDSQAKAFDIGDRKAKTAKGAEGAKKGSKSRPKREPKAAQAKTSSNKTAPQAEVLDEEAALPTRNKHGELVFKDHPEFKPNLTPKEVLHRGSFGGTYYRPITSSVTDESYTNVHKEFPADWFKDIDLKTTVIAKKYNPAVNKYGVKCGGDLDMWEGSGWISNIDPCKQSPQTHRHEYAGCYIPITIHSLIAPHLFHCFSFFLPQMAGFSGTAGSTSGADQPMTTGRLPAGEAWQVTKADSATSSSVAALVGARSSTTPQFLR